eukprot:scaffold140127_cov247-Phaeocystis_antarctica.AAC.2
MSRMFYVRSARALAPSLVSVHPRVCRLRRHHPQRLHASRAAPLPASHARLLTRQRAYEFNQSLSFDTSMVTDMSRMFFVRSARALAPTALSRSIPVRADCVATTPNAFTPPGPYTSSRCAPFDSAGRVCVRPAAQLRHVQRHDHGRHVRRALRACPGPHSLESGPPHACRYRRRHPTPPRLPGRPTRMPAFRLGSPRGRSNCRSASTHPRSRTWAACSWCAPRVPWLPQP